MTGTNSGFGYEMARALAQFIHLDLADLVSLRRFSDDFTHHHDMLNILINNAPQDIAFFHGAVDPNKLNFYKKWILNNVKSPLGDFRDWDTVISWANFISQNLMEK